MSQSELRIMRGTAPEIRSSDGAPVLTGYAAIYNTYSKNLGGFVEQVLPSAFDDSLSRSVPVVARGNHDPNWMIGSTETGTLRLSSDDTGLRYEIDLDEMDPDCVRAQRKVETHKMVGSSFRFAKAGTKDSWSRTDQDYPLRSLITAPLMDVGPVFNAAYAPTEGHLAIALRSLSEEIEVELEELLHAAETNELRSYPLPGDEPVETVILTPETSAEQPRMYRRVSGLSVPVPVGSR